MTPRTLKQIEIWTARIVQTHDLAVDYCVLRKIVKTFDYKRELFVDGLVPSREQREVAL